MQTAKYLAPLLLLILLLGTAYAWWHYYQLPPKPELIIQESYPYQGLIQFDIKSAKPFYLFKEDFQILKQEGPSWITLSRDVENFVMCDQIRIDKIEPCKFPQAALAPSNNPEFRKATTFSEGWNGLVISTLRNYTCTRMQEDQSMQVQESCASLDYLSPGDYRVQFTYYEKPDPETRRQIEKFFQIKNI